MKKGIMLLGVCYLSMVAIAAGAHMDGVRQDFGSCKVEFDSDITVDPDTVEIAIDSGKRMVISHVNELFVDGDRIDLDAEQRALLARYAAEVRATIPKIVTIALEGVEIGLTAVSEVFYAFSENGPPESLLSSIDGIQEEISARMYRDGNTVHMKGGELRGLESTMSELEPALEDAISESIGDMIMSVGTSLKEGDGSLADRIADLGQTMTRLETDIETRLSAKAEQLAQQADGLCEQVYALQATESMLHVKVPATRGFDLVKDSAATY